MSLAFALMAAINGSTGSCATLSHGLQQPHQASPASARRQKNSHPSWVAAQGPPGTLSRKPWATGSEHNRRFHRPRVSPSRRNRGQSATESTTWETAALLLAHKKTDPARVYATASRIRGYVLQHIIESMCCFRLCAVREPDYAFSGPVSRNAAHNRPAPRAARRCAHPRWRRRPTRVQLVTRRGRRERDPVIRGVSHHALDRDDGLTAAAGVAYQLSEPTAVAGRTWRLCDAARRVISG